MIPDGRRRPHRKAEKDIEEDRAHVHDYAVSDHAVVPRQTQKLHVIKHIHDRKGNVREQFRSAVRTRAEKRLHVAARFAKSQQARIRAAEIDKSDHARHRLPRNGCRRRARKLPMKSENEERVERAVQNARGNRNPKPEHRLFGGNHKALKGILQHQTRHAAQQNKAVKHGVFHRFGRGVTPQKLRHGAQNGDPKAAEHDARDGDRANQKGKITVGALLIALAQRFGDERAAARAEHHARRAQNHNNGENEVQPREGSITHRFGNEHTVYDRINRSKHRHHDGRHHKTQ